MERIEGGYWYLLFGVLVFGFTLVEHTGGQYDKARGRLEGLGVWCIRYAAACALALLVGSILCGLGIAAWSAYTFLRFGVWAPYSAGDLLFIVDLLPRRSTGWVGIDRMIFGFARWSGLIVLLLIIPIPSLFAAIWLIVVADKKTHDANPGR